MSIKKNNYVSNKNLYEKIKKIAKTKFKKWPSAYASSWLVKEYKRRAGKYSGKRKSKSVGLKRWYSEKWINVCKLPKIVPCGRPKLSISSWKKNYPYCRPLKRITQKSPRTALEISKKELKKRCSIKRRNPMKRIL